MTKFRGVDANGQTWYGGFYEDESGTYIINSNREFVSVQPYSVAQFCGYDGDGQEVYEHDDLAPRVNGMYDVNNIYTVELETTDFSGWYLYR